MPRTLLGCNWSGRGIKPSSFVPLTLDPDLAGVLSRSMWNVHWVRWLPTGMTSYWKASSWSYPSAHIVMIITWIDRNNGWIVQVHYNNCLLTINYQRVIFHRWNINFGKHVVKCSCYFLHQIITDSIGIYTPYKVSICNPNRQIHNMITMCRSDNSFTHAFCFP